MTEDSPALATRPFPFALCSRNCVFALYGLSAAWGAVQIAIPDSGALYWLFTLLFAISATGWARFDSLARSQPMLPVLQMLYFLVWPLGALVYLVARSGWRGIGIGLAHGVSLFATLLLAFNLTRYCLHFAGLLELRYYAEP